MTRRASLLFLLVLIPGLISLAPVRTLHPPESVSKSSAISLPQMAYGHALVASGIHSVSDLADAMEREPKLYPGFDLSRAKASTVKESFWAHTSYRKNGRIYFTKNPVLILAGETIYTDGNIMIRARCGNELSVVPLTPVLTDEPPDTELLTPPSFEIPVPDQPIPTVPTGSPIPPPTTETPIAPPPIFPIVPPLCCAAFPVTLPPTPTPETPEPETLVLFGTGLVALIYWRKR
jgi:hypothetical protein